MKSWHKIARAGVAVCTFLFLLATWIRPSDFASKVATTGVILIVPFMLWAIIAHMEE